ncbi:unnamed protein product [Linum trigynum]|uniref:Uncharacterized protein n=1 Tax=Linum trigynum TaxID=586398 RepID=A0AAV2CFZ5_9ROSI
MGPSKRVWQARITVIGEVVPNKVAKVKEVAKEKSLAMDLVEGWVETIGVLRRVETVTPPPEAGLITDDRFTLVVNRRQKTKVGPSGVNQGFRRSRLDEQSFPRLQQSRSGSRNVDPLPSLPRGRGRGRR